MTAAEIETCTKSFLKSARDRDCGRQKRMKKKNVPASSVSNYNVRESSVNNASDSEDTES